MTLYTQEFGPAGAPTIVFLHGGGVGGWTWKPQIAQLQDEYHLLVPDLPEHGQSAEVKPMTLQNAAVQVAELVRTRAHGGRAHVVGFSLGAQTTIELLSETPELIDHVPPNLQTVTVPTLLLVGEKELKIMRESVRDLLAAMPAARGYVVTGAIHNWSMQLPDLFTQIVRAWSTARALPGELVALR